MTVDAPGARPHGPPTGEAAPDAHPPGRRERKPRAVWRFGAPPVDDRPAGDVACRNCRADAPGAYCPACGQETALQLPSAGRFMREAAGRYVAFDGRMWRTLAALLFRPGFLTREYLAGRRKRYVRPARLVLVLAIVLFAAMRLFANPDVLVQFDSDKPAAGAPAGKGGAPGATKAVPAPEPLSRSGEPAGASGSGAAADAAGDHAPLTIGNGGAGLRIDEALNMHLIGVELPLSDRIEKRFESFNRLDRAQKAREIVGGMLRYGPYALVAMLPAFALLMQVLYAGRRRRYPGRPHRYAEHLVYGAHNHAFVALAGTLAFAIPAGWATVVLVGWTIVYLLWSMHAVYGGRWSGVIARGVVALVAYVVIFALAVAGLVLAAVVLR